MGTGPDKINAATANYRAIRIDLFRVFIVVLGSGDTIGFRQPAVEVDIAAALGTKWP